MSASNRKTMSAESEDIFSASSSALLGTKRESPLVAKLEDQQVVLTSVENPSKELLRTSIKAAYERIAAAATLTRKQLYEIYKQHQVHSQNWFRMSVIAAFIGFLIILVGVVVMLFGYTNAGLVSTVVGIVSETVAALFYKQARAANNQLRSDLLKLIDAERIHQAVELALTLDNPQLRDQLKVSIIKLAIQDNSVLSKTNEKRGLSNDTDQ